MEASSTSPRPPTNGNPTKAQLLLIADFKPPSSERAWVSIPNPNGLPLIATATSDKSVRVYSLTNFTLHSKLDGGHQRSVRSVAWKPTQEGHKVLTIATGSFDHTMGIWRRREEGGEDTRGQGDAHEADIGGEPPLELEVTRNGVIQNNEDDSEANEDWEFSIVLEGHDAEIKSVAYSPSGQWLASCSRDKQIWIWEEIGDEGDDEFETVAVLTDHEADIKCVCWRSAQGYNDQGEVLASSSYDDTIRLWREEDEGEWGCFAVMEGHQGTVWSLNWEPEVSLKRFSKSDDENRIPRLLSSSADHTIKIWSQIHSPPPPNAPSYLNSGIPSTMRPAMANETWVCTATLPAAHDLPIYSIGWSKESGRVVSAAGDGKVVIYEEKKKEPSSSATVPEVTVDQHPQPNNLPETEWVIIAELQGAHGPYEVNHVAWCQRFDGGKSRDGEEMIVTTGDDGNVRAWALQN